MLFSIGFSTSLEKTRNHYKNLNEIHKLIHQFTNLQARALTFGYMSDHYIVLIPETCSGIRYDSIKKLKCEIQVRTVSMHAWATVSHQLDYKQDVDVPSQFKSDFYALSGIFYVADSLFEQFRNARDESARILIKEAMDNEFNLDAEINLDTMRSFLQWKLPDRVQKDDARTISGILTDLTKANVNTYQELNSIIDENIEWLIQDEIKDPPRERLKIKGVIKTQPTTYSSVGVIRVILRKLGRIK